MTEQATLFNSKPWWLKASILIVLGALLGYRLATDEGLAVNFTNLSDQAITSIKLDFGSVASQSSILIFRLEPQESQKVFLNHPVGMGFNVLVTYADGQQQEFCALKDDKNSRPELKLTL